MRGPELALTEPKPDDCAVNVQARPPVPPSKSPSRSIFEPEAALGGFEDLVGTAEMVEELDVESEVEVETETVTATSVVADERLSVVVNKRASTALEDVKRAGVAVVVRVLKVEASTVEIVVRVLKEHLFFLASAIVMERAAKIRI